jgi:hypothetical protein
LRVKSSHQAANDRCPLFPQQRTFVDQAAPTASGAALTGFSITGVTMISTGTFLNCSRLRRHRRRVHRSRTCKHQEATPLRWIGPGESYAKMSALNGWLPRAV